MTRRRLSAPRGAAWLALVAGVLWCVSAAAQTGPQRARPGPILVVKSKAVAAYELPTERLVNTLKPLRSVVLSLGEDGANSLRAASTPPPALVVALGSRALAAVREQLPNAPTLYAMVLAPEKVLGPTRPANVAGIALDVPFDAVMTQLIMAKAGIKRVGVIFHPATSGARIAVARKHARLLMLDLVELPVSGADQAAPRLSAAAGRLDALWMVPDPVAYTRASYRAVVEATWRMKLPFCAFSRAFVVSGALLSVAPSYGAVGEQLALLARRILDDKTPPAAIGEVAPIGTELIINEGVAKRLELTIDPDVLESADELLEGEPTP